MVVDNITINNSIKRITAAAFFFSFTKMYQHNWLNDSIKNGMEICQYVFKSLNSWFEYVPPIAAQTYIKIQISNQSERKASDL